VNYDGETDITATSTKTFEQGVVVIGRAKAWTERDFSYDITGGVDFMQNIAEQVAGYWEGIDQEQILAILNGIFAMTGAKNLEFVQNHTYTEAGNMSATTLNSATQKACGANKKAFNLVIMHSAVATNLENLKVLSFLTQTDKEGLTREIGLATWNGKAVVIDDDMPVKEVAASGSGDSAVAAQTEYTSYVLGNGAFSYEDIGAKIPYEMARDAATNGGVDTLYTRQRKVFSPFGISYEKADQASASPTDAELAKGANWTLVHSGESTESKRTYINHKAIPIARIISWG
ncbi:MAG: phage coat protein, partial [Clostridia bacterium]|nr:phage coat protein [Clostridia bacterium]